LVVARGEEAAKQNADTIQLILNRTGVRRYLGKQNLL
jgi:hypothetical protein